MGFETLVEQEHSLDPLDISKGESHPAFLFL